MKNAAALLLMALLSSLAIAGNNPESSTFFHKGDFEQIKVQASEEGKLIFVDFYADYCYACKLMDETTFVDPNLTKYVSNSYIPYKVNVTIDFDGIAMKDEYNIKVLPTILVFNSKGELVGRYESMLGPTRMIRELKKYDVPENRIKSGNTTVVEEEPVLAATPPTKPAKPTITYNRLTSKINTAPDRAINVSDNRINGHATTYEEPNPNNYQDDKQVYAYANPKTKKTEVTKENSTFPKKENTPTEYNTEATKEEASEPEQDIVPVEGLFQFTVKPYRNQGFGVQIGVFAQYGNVLREVQKLQEKYNQPILVNISKLNGVVVYKIIVGAFDSTREAVAFRRMMRKKGSDGVIKNLSTIKL